MDATTNKEIRDIIKAEMVEKISAVKAKYNYYPNQFPGLCEIEEVEIPNEYAEDAEREIAQIKEHYKNMMIETAKVSNGY